MSKCIAIRFNIFGQYIILRTVQAPKQTTKPNKAKDFYVFCEPSVLCK